MERQDRKLDYRGQTIYVGIDVHRKNWRVTTLLEDAVQKTFHLSPAGPQELAAYLHRHYPGADYKCAYEAGFSGYWAQEGLTALGIETQIFHAADIPTSDKDRQQKDDSRDSQKIAHCLKQGRLSGIYIPSKEQQQDRDLVRRRAALVSNRRRAMTRIKMHLHFVGSFPAQGTTQAWHWNKAFHQWLEQQAGEDLVLASMLKELNYARHLEQEVTKQIRQVFTKEPYKEQLALLKTIPGVGFLTAVVLLTEIGDMRRFKTLDQLCFYVGIVPRTDNSGDRIRAEQRTHRGNKRLRTALIECAWASIHYDSELTLCFVQLCKRMERNHAIIKIARKMLNRIRRVLLSQQAYQPAQA
ncbi:MAG TPA: IS110 family transposase [Nitrosomonas sp.]|nr:IS110 family transposase [Nitrosomonas sp.]